jgi:hypothetical protein
MKRTLANHRASGSYQNSTQGLKPGVPWAFSARVKTTPSSKGGSLGIPVKSCPFTKQLDAVESLRMRKRLRKSSRFCCWLGVTIPGLKTETRGEPGKANSKANQTVVEHSPNVH